MNFRYNAPADRSLEDLMARSPGCDIDTIRRAIPALDAMSEDHLALRIDHILRQRTFAQAK